MEEGKVSEEPAKVPQEKLDAVRLEVARWQDLGRQAIAVFQHVKESHQVGQRCNCSTCQLYDKIWEALRS